MRIHMSEWILPDHWLHTAELWRKLVVMSAGSNEQPGPYHPCFGGELESAAESADRWFHFCIENGQSALGLLFHIVAFVPQALCRCQLFEKLSYCSHSHRDDMFSVLNCRGQQSGLSTHLTRSYTSYLFFIMAFTELHQQHYSFEKRHMTWNVCLWDQNHGAQL